MQNIKKNNYEKIYETSKKDYKENKRSEKQKIKEIKKEIIRERKTLQKEVILQEIKKMNTHPTAIEVYLEVRKKIPNISLGTIYRNLEIMNKRGLIKKLTGEYSNRYDGKTDKHFHFICKKCNKIYDLPNESNENLDMKIKERIVKLNQSTNNKYEIGEYEIIFYGLCYNCK